MGSSEYGPELDRMLVDLDDPDPLVRQEAAIALGDFCPKDHPAVNCLIDRLGSFDQTFHDRACAAWALGRIGAKTAGVVPILLALIDGLRDQDEADELRNYSAEAIENLTGELEVLAKVARYCLQDRYWKCRMRGVFIIERLLKRDPDLRDSFMSLIEPRVKDDLEEIREHARRITDAFEKTK